MKFSRILYLFLSLAVFVALISADSKLPATIDKSKYGNNILSLSATVDLTMYFIVEGDELEVALECACLGFVGWGMSKATGMLNSDVYIGWVTNGVPNASDYTIGTSRSYSLHGVWPDDLQGGTDDLLDFNGNEDNGVTQMLFRRKLQTGDSLDVQLSSTGGSNVLIYTWAISQDGPHLIQHPKNPVPVNLNFFTGAASKVFNIIIIHGAFMFITWFGIAPWAGYLLAHFFKKKFSWWFQAHRAIMFFAMLLQLAAFGIAIKYVGPGNHFNDTHKIIGLIVVILGTSQPVIGFLADKLFDPSRAATPFFPDKTHWLLGWISITLGMINIILGLIEYGYTAYGVIVAYCVLAAVSFTFLFAGYFIKLFRDGGSEGHD